jgi:hypothetical protein
MDELPRTTVEVDDALLAAAATVLGTTGAEETVRAALQQAARLRPGSPSWPGRPGSPDPTTPGRPGPPPGPPGSPPDPGTPYPGLPPRPPGHRPGFPPEIH